MDHTPDIMNHTPDIMSPSHTDGEGEVHHQSGLAPYNPYPHIFDRTSRMPLTSTENTTDPASTEKQVSKRQRRKMARELASLQAQGSGSTKRARGGRKKTRKQQRKIFAQKWHSMTSEERAALPETEELKQFFLDEKYKTEKGRRKALRRRARRETGGLVPTARGTEGSMFDSNNLEDDLADGENDARELDHHMESINSGHERASDLSTPSSPNILALNERTNPSTPKELNPGLHASADIRYDIPGSSMDNPILLDLDAPLSKEREEELAKAREERDTRAKNRQKRRDEIEATGGMASQVASAIREKKLCLKLKREVEELGLSLTPGSDVLEVRQSV